MRSRSPAPRRSASPGPTASQPRRASRRQLRGHDEGPAPLRPPLLLDQADPADRRHEVPGEKNLDATYRVPTERPVRYGPSGEVGPFPAVGWRRQPGRRNPPCEHERRAPGVRLVDERHHLTHGTALGVGDDDEGAATGRLTAVEHARRDPRRRLEMGGGTAVGREADDPAAVTMCRDRRGAQLLVGLQRAVRPAGHDDPGGHRARRSESPRVAPRRGQRRCRLERGRQSVAQCRNLPRREPSFDETRRDAPAPGRAQPDGARAVSHELARAEVLIDGGLDPLDGGAVVQAGARRPDQLTPVEGVAEGLGRLGDGDASRGSRPIPAGAVWGAAVPSLPTEARDTPSAKACSRQPATSAG